MNINRALAAAARQSTFDSSHELWGAKLDWGSGGGAGFRGERPSEKIGGYTATKVFYLEIDPTNQREPQLVIAKDKRGPYDWKNADRRDLTPADIGMLTTILAEYVAASDAERAASSNSAQRKVIADQVRALQAALSAVPDLAHAMRDLEHLEQRASHPPIESGLVRSAREIIGVINNPNTYRPVATSARSEGTSILARRLSGEV